MITVGLTGSIGIGKSTVSAMFAALGAQIWSADDAVHRIYGPGGAAVDPVGAVFPDAIIDGGVDRGVLSGLVLGQPALLKTLEEIVHPLVATDRVAFLAKAKREKAGLVVLDIPLLFEGGSETFFDCVIVCSAPSSIQRERVLARDGMSAEKFEAILQKQMPDEQKRLRADYIINTGQSLEETKLEAEAIYRELIKTHRDGPPKTP